MAKCSSNLPWVSDTFINEVVEAFNNTHALLINGPQAIGKSHLAAKACRALLERISTQQTTNLVQAGTHPDFHVLTSAFSYYQLDCGLKNSALRYLDAEALEKKRLSRQISVESIRLLISNMSESSALGGYKLAVIYPAEDLNKNSANALLKFLEEPPAQTLIILISHDISKLPATIRSRCVRLNFPIPDTDASRQWLQQIYSENDGIENALTLASDRPLLAQQYLQNNQQQIVDVLINDVEQLVSAGETEANVISIARKWIKLKQTDFILNWLCQLFSDLIKIKSSASKTRSGDYGSKLLNISEQLSVVKLFDVYDYFLTVNQRYDGVADESLMLEDLILTITSTAIENA